MAADRKSVLRDRPRLVSLHGELAAAWRSIEGCRFDDPFAGRGLIRFGKALIAFHEAVEEDA